MRRWLKFLTIFLVACFISWGTGFFCFLYEITHLQNSTERADGVVIFTGGRDRIRKGLALLHGSQGNTPLLISGVHTPDQLQEISSHAQIKDLITLGYFATNTEENAEETKRWATQYGCKSLKLVTSHYHMPRSLLELKKNMPSVRIIPYSVLSPIFHDRDWIFNFKRWRILFSEYNKYTVVLMKYLVSY